MALRFVATAMLWAIAAGWAPSVDAHGEEDHREASPDTSILAPGYGELGFEAPPAGSYELPPLGAAADGAVLTSYGEEASLHELFGGRIAILSFIYASCSDTNGCPLATAVLQRLGARLAQDPRLVDQTQLVSLSFDPERDTPDVMARYGETFRGKGLDWSFVTTRSPEALRPILEAYGQAVVVERDKEGLALGPIAHLLRVYLIDAERRIRNIYTVSFLHPETLARDVETLLLEQLAASDHGSQTPSAGPPTAGPGDDRDGYERAGYRTRSIALSARRGEAIDLVLRAQAKHLGLPALVVPEGEELTRDKVELGRRLFYDRRLSHNDTFSCATCHIPEQGFSSNEQATAVGIEGRSVRRNAPSLYNVAFVESLFHDGRENRLEQQIWGPLLARNEMGNPSVGFVVEKVRGLDGYAGAFERAFPGEGLTMAAVGRAIASYERTLLSGNSAFDRWHFGGEEDAIGEPAKRGFALFAGRARCIGCHAIGRESALFSDGRFHDTGVGYAATMQPTGTQQEVIVSPGRSLLVDRAIVARVAEPRAGDLGRYEITQDPGDRWRYRTPGLRNVGLSAPYMHDGSLRSLAGVVDFYDRGGVPHDGLDSRIQPLDLSPMDKSDLLAFLHSLTGEDIQELVSDAFAAPVGDPR